VLPPDAVVNGLTLTDAAAATGVFNTGSHSEQPPNVPFRMLFTAPNSSTNSFVFPPDTPLYVPVVAITDSPPIIGTFPTTHEQALGYFFDPSQLGGHDFSITVDGQTTVLSHDYLAGPVETPPLQDGGGTHYLVVAAFLAPLPLGKHTVSIAGEANGQVLLAFTGGQPFEVSAEYTVTVAEVHGTQPPNAAPPISAP
jgi:hypothetical protein